MRDSINGDFEVHGRHSSHKDGGRFVYQERDAGMLWIQPKITSSDETDLSNHLICTVKKTVSGDVRADYPCGYLYMIRDLNGIHLLWRPVWVFL